MIIIYDLNYLEDLSRETNIDTSTVLGCGMGSIVLINQETNAFASAKAINGDATAIANAEGTFSYSPPSRSIRSRFTGR
ncbi:MAG: hypothetical protein AAGE84_00895 [Cyanobacteria bacterium P01_G01_bin.39]